MPQNVVLAAFGLLLFILFVGYLAFQIAALPLVLIIGAVTLMCAYDFWLTLREDG